MRGNYIDIRIEVWGLVEIYCLRCKMVVFKQYGKLNVKHL